jgi:hypothetical protein
MKNGQKPYLPKKVKKYFQNLKKLCHKDKDYLYELQAFVKLSDLKKFLKLLGWTFPLKDYPPNYHEIIDKLFEEDTLLKLLLNDPVNYLAFILRTPKTKKDLKFMGRCKIDCYGLDFVEYLLQLIKYRKSIKKQRDRFCSLMNQLIFSYILKIKGKKIFSHISWQEILEEFVELRSYDKKN